MRNYPRYTGFASPEQSWEEGKSKSNSLPPTDAPLRSASVPPPLKERPGRKRVRMPEHRSGHPVPRSLFQEVAEGFKELERLRTKPLPYPIGRGLYPGDIVYSRNLQPGDTIVSVQLASAYPDYKSVYRWNHEHGAWVPTGFMLKRARR